MERVCARVQQHARSLDVPVAARQHERDQAAASCAADCNPSGGEEPSGLLGVALLGCQRQGGGSVSLARRAGNDAPTQQRLDGGGVAINAGSHQLAVPTRRRELDSGPRPEQCLDHGQLARLSGVRERAVAGLVGLVYGLTLLPNENALYAIEPTCQNESRAPVGRRGAGSRSHGNSLSTSNRASASACINQLTVEPHLDLLGALLAPRPWAQDEHDRQHGAPEASILQLLPPLSADVASALPSQPTGAATGTRKRGGHSGRARATQASRTPGDHPAARNGLCLASQSKGRTRSAEPGV